MKKILLTGASGLLGLNFYLQNKKFIIKPLIHKKKINLINSDKLDLLNFTKLNNIIEKFKPDIILHTAALTDVDKCEQNKNLATNLNINITKNLVEVSKLYNLKLIFISTDQLFKKNRNYFKESDRPNPVNFYAKTKKISEDIIKKKLRNYLIIRTNFFGWGTKYKKSFSDRIIESLRNNKVIQLFDDVYFNPVSIDFLCKIINKLIIKEAYGTFNISSNLSISKYQFGIIISKVFKLNQKLIVPINLSDKKIIKRPLFMSLSNKKLVKTLKISSKQLNIFKQINDLKKYS